MSEDVAVVGAGVIGLAVARELALRGREVTVLEAERACGTHTSSRNSEVIHAGLYYARDSLKGRLCVRGKELLYAYCAARGVPHARLGKLLVATSPEEEPALRKIRASAEANGVHDLVDLTIEQARELEPEVRCTKAMLSPSTGIVDSHALIAALRTDAQQAGAAIALGTRVTSGKLISKGAELDGVAFRQVVNCAGPWAQDVARSIEGVPRETIPPQFFGKGHYFTLAQKAPFKRLVYPVPIAGGLGVHLTLDMAGRARFGPDVSFTDRVEYSFDDSRAPAFYASVRRYWPALPDGALQPGFTGVRPKIAKPGGAGTDFLIDKQPGFLSLYGFESPGLTACLAIAEHVRALVEQT